ncbi:MAG: hypothetical protein ACLU9T_10825 [Blautia faecis]
MHRSSTIIHSWQKKASMTSMGSTLSMLADEWYILAEEGCCRWKSPMMAIFSWKTVWECFGSLAKK